MFLTSKINKECEKQFFNLKKIGKSLFWTERNQLENNAIFESPTTTSKNTFSIVPFMNKWRRQSLKLSKVLLKKKHIFGNRN